MTHKKSLMYLIPFILLAIVAAEWIGFRSLSLGRFTINILPLVFAVLITMIFAIPLWRKGILKKIYSPENIKFASGSLMFIMLPLMARYGADVAPNLKEILKVGWVFLLQELGNTGTVILGMPIALLLGLRREAIGATLGLGREGELAYISEKYTLDSAEGRGVLSLYLIGTLFGPIFFSIVAPLFLKLGLDYRALAMASGPGSASMMAASSASIAALMPTEAMAETVRSYAAASQLLTSFLGTYTMFFIAIPMQRFFYNFFTKGDHYDHGK